MLARGHLFERERVDGSWVLVAAISDLKRVENGSDLASDLRLLLVKLDSDLRLLLVKLSSDLRLLLVKLGSDLRLLFEKLSLGLENGLCTFLKLSLGLENRLCSFLKPFFFFFGSK